MTVEDYKKNIERLQQIEAEVKNPETALDKIDTLLEETKKLASECQAYTRGLHDKVDSLNNILD